jgi:hypothetical protein
LLRRANCPDDEGDAHGGGGSKEERAATDAVNEQSARNRDDERENGETTVETKLGVAIGDTNALEDVGSIVGDETVARPLGEETEGCEEQEPVPVALGLEKIEVGRSLLV